MQEQPASDKPRYEALLLSHVLVGFLFMPLPLIIPEAAAHLALCFVSSLRRCCSDSSAHVCHVILQIIFVKT